MFVVIEGEVDVWDDRDRICSRRPTSGSAPAGVFGFSSMLTERSVGPRVVAAARDGGGDPGGGRSRPPSPPPRGPASWPSTCPRPSAGLRTRPTYSLVDELIATEPLVVEPHRPGVRGRPADDRAAGRPAPCVDAGGGRFGIVTDALLRRRPDRRRAARQHPGRSRSWTRRPRPYGSGDSAAEALILLLERDAEFLVVAGRRPAAARGRRAPGLRRLTDHCRGVAARAAAPRRQRRRAGQPGPTGTGMLDDLLGRRPDLRTG